MTKILLVEDDKSLREIYGVRLLAEGYDIVSAGDGEEALAMAIKERPNLIISDVMMPKISGFDMLDILRSTTETRGIKVIMMTALSSEDQRKRGESLGADRYLVKSQVGIEDVVKTVHEVLADGHLTPEERTADKSEPKGDPITETSEQTPQTTQSQTRQPVPAPTAPQVASRQPQPPVQDTGLPRPVAPFSTNRPGTGSSVSERVIHPPTPTTQSEVNEQVFAQQMESILSGQAQEAAPQQPAQPTSSAPQSQPQMPPTQNAPANTVPSPAPAQQPAQPPMQQPQVATTPQQIRMQPQQPTQPAPAAPQPQPVRHTQPTAPQQQAPQPPARPDFQPLSQPSRPDTPTFGAR
jgi:CheY-like chemotaxis protein